MLAAEYLKIMLPCRWAASADLLELEIPLDWPVVPGVTPQVGSYADPMFRQDAALDQMMELLSLHSCL